MQIRTLMMSILVACQTAVQSQHCRTPSGHPGECKLLSACSNLPVASNAYESLAEFISPCGGGSPEIPTVCCPKESPTPAMECFTPDAQEGKCVSLYNCRHLESLLSHPSEGVINFISDSQCNGPYKYSVCCGPKAPTFTDHITPDRYANCTLTYEPPDPQSGCCGVESVAGDRIFGGENAEINQYPWMALIEYRTENNKTRLLCGGALISGRYVLTAGHCVVIKNETLLGKPTNVRLGEHDTSNDPKEPDCTVVSGGGIVCNEGGIVIPIEKVIPHKDFNKPAILQNDIALLRLAYSAPFTDFIRPICLPQTDIATTDLPDIVLYISGWGAVSTSQKSSKIKQNLAVPFIQDCQLYEGQICAGGDENKNACKGDSGGPLMRENDDVYEAVGILSFGSNDCALKDVPAVYTNVYQYISWLRENMEP